MKLVIHTDGGARGNPGPSAVGVVIEEFPGKKIAEFGKTIGETTNNVAEYTGVIEALRWIVLNREKGNDFIQFYLDSTLVVNQINGLFKVKDARLRGLLSEVRVLEGEIGAKIQYTAVPRNQNSQADFLVNKALDQEV